MVSFVDILLVIAECFLIKKTFDGFVDLRHAIKDIPVHSIPIHKPLPPIIPLEPPLGPPYSPLIPLHRPIRPPWRPPENRPAGICPAELNVSLYTYSIPTTPATQVVTAKNQEGVDTVFYFTPTFGSTGDLCGWEVTSMPFVPVRGTEPCVYSFPDDVFAGGHVVYDPVRVNPPPSQCQ